MGVTLQTPPDTDSPNPNFPKPAHPQTPALMATPSAQPGQAVQTRQGSRWPVRGRRTELLPLSWPRGRLVGFSRSLKRFWGANRGESEGSGWAPRPWGQAAPAGRRPLSPLAFAIRSCNSESGKAWPRCAGRVKASCDRPAAGCLAWPPGRGCRSAGKPMPSFTFLQPTRLVCSGPVHGVVAAGAGWHRQARSPAGFSGLEAGGSAWLHQPQKLPWHPGPDSG